MGLMYLLKANHHKLRTTHESRSLNRRINHLLNVIENETCSEERLQRTLTSIYSILNDALRFNKSSGSDVCAIPVPVYEARVRRVQRKGPIFSSHDGNYFF